MFKGVLRHHGTLLVDVLIISREGVSFLRRTYDVLDAPFHGSLDRGHGPEPVKVVTGEESHGANKTHLFEEVSREGIRVFRDFYKRQFELEEFNISHGGIRYKTCLEKVGDGTESHDT